METVQTPIISCKDVKKYYPLRKGLFNRTVGWKKVVDGVSFSVKPGETLALVELVLSEDVRRMNNKMKNRDLDIPNPYLMII